MLPLLCVQELSSLSFSVHPSPSLCSYLHVHVCSVIETRQGKARQGKTRQGKARQGKARQGKAGQGKARQGKARQGRRKTTPLLPKRKRRAASGTMYTCMYMYTVHTCTCTHVFTYVILMQKNVDKQQLS